MKETRNKAMNEVLKEIERRGICLSEYELRDDFGKDTVCEFKVKGVRRWMFGIWVYRNKEEKKYTISIFGEHEDYIDKFKPTATEISYRCDVPKLKDIHEDVMFFEFEMDLRRIKSHPMLEMYFHYSNRIDSVLLFLLSQFWFYRVREPFVHFCKTYLIDIYLHIVAFFYKLRFKKKGVNFDISIKNYNKGSDLWHRYPIYDFQVVYGNNDEEVVRDIHHKLNKAWDRYWLIPRFIGRELFFINAKNTKDTRGFYYSAE